MPTLAWNRYVDDDAFVLERERLFRHAWHYVGHRDTMGEPRTVTPCEVGTVPAIVTCDRDGTLRAFANVCRHRGSTLVTERTCRSTVQCPYHAWTYGLDGALVVAPRAQHEPGFDAATLGLVPLALATWGPFVFVAHQPRQPLDEWLGDVPRSIEACGVDVEELRFVTRATGSVEANWKVVCENYLECYHCQVAHPGFSALVDVAPDAYELDAHGAVFSQRTPLRERTSAPVGAGPMYDPAGAVEAGVFHFVFPSLMVNVAPGHANLSLGPVLPASPSRTRRFLDYFAGSDAPDAWVRDLLAWDDQVGAEDVQLVEAVQRGMAAGVVERGVLVADERLVEHFQRLVYDGTA